MARRVRWTGSYQVFSLPAASVASVSLLTDSDENMERGHTLLRIRGMVNVRADAASSSQFRGGLGITALTAGVTSAGLPDPTVDHSANWLLNVPFAIAHEGSAGVSGQISYHWTIDNKGKRIMGDHQELRIIGANFEGAALTVSFGLRILFALP